MPGKQSAAADRAVVLYLQGRGASAACRLAGVSRSTLYRALQRLGLALRVRVSVGQPPAPAKPAEGA